MSGELSLDSVKIALDGATLVDLTATVAPGAVLTVMGPSGAGKSSLLAFIGGFLPSTFASSGRVILNGTDLTALAPHRRRVGLLFQDDLLFPHLSVGENLLFALPSGIAGRTGRRRAAEDALAEIDMAGMFDRDPATLSGGQRARVALARVLLARPAVLLLDEPFARLDQALRDQIRALVFGEAKKRQLPVLLVTHDPADATAAGGKVVNL